MLWFRTDLAYELITAYELAWEAGEADAEIVEQLREGVEAAAQDLRASTCLQDADCGDGMRCSVDSACKRLNFECDDVEGVHEM